jgi:hypothetical protein
VALRAGRVIPGQLWNRATQWVVTVADLFAGKKPDLPIRHEVKTFKKPPATKREPEKKQAELCDS